MVSDMIDSLFDKGTMKKFDDLAKKQAELNIKKSDLVKKTMLKIDTETVKDVIGVVKKYGHPDEKILSEEIGSKYFSGNRLDFDDLMNLDNLYKSNFERFSKKDADNE